MYHRGWTIDFSFYNCTQLEAARSTDKKVGKVFLFEDREIVSVDKMFLLRAHKLEICVLLKVILYILSDKASHHSFWKVASIQRALEIMFVEFISLFVGFSIDFKPSYNPLVVHELLASPIQPRSIICIVEQNKCVVCNNFWIWSVNSRVKIKRSNLKNINEYKET